MVNVIKNLEVIHMRILRQSRKDLMKIAEQKDIVIFGAGEMTMRLFNTIDIVDKVKFICDDTESRRSSRLYGIKIVGSEKLKELNPDKTVIVISSKNQQKEFAKQVESIGDFDIYFTRVLISETFEAVACDLYDHQDEIAQAEKLLIDDTSKKIYREVIYRRMLFGEDNFSDLIIDGDVEYILPQMFSESIPKDEIIVDCGAYTGDTVELFCKEFGKKVKKIWALECGQEQLELLKQRVDRLHRLPYSPEICVLPYAVSDKNEKLDFYQPMASKSSFIGNNRAFARNDKYNSEIYQVDAVALDYVLPQNESVTMIKMDVEGSEFAALMGAKELIQRNRPKLIISIYHSGLDYFRLILLIKELVPEYKFAIRHHKKLHIDTDLYAWI